jgi:hypothetical protein
LTDSKVLPTMKTGGNEDHEEECNYGEEKEERLTTTT